MRDLKWTRPIVGTRQGAGSTQTSVPLIIAHGEDVDRCVQYFLHDPCAPCCDLASRRAYALATLYIDGQYRVTEDILRGAEDECTIGYEMLATMLRSGLRLRRATAANIIHALIDAGVLTRAKDGYGRGVAHE